MMAHHLVKHQHGKKFKHVKTGGIYEILATGLIEATLMPCVIYSGNDGTVWVRPHDEFNDGRFVLIEPEATDQRTAGKADERYPRF